MAKKIWNVAIVGPGWVAGAYMEAFRKRDDVRVTHVVGRRRESAAAFASQHGLSCGVHEKLEDALGHEDIDIVGVFTPHHLHAELILTAAKARKHIIIEKPVVLTVEALKAVRKAVKEAGVKTIVGFVLRWNPLLKMIRQNIEAGHLGKIIFAEADYLHGLVGKPYTKPWHLTRETGGTSLLLAGCHAVAAVRFLVRRPVVEVQAYATGRTRELEYPSTGLVLMKFDDGSIGKVASCVECKMPYVFNVEVYGTEGTFRNNQFYSDILKGQTGFATVPTIMPDSADVSHHPFDGEVAELINAINGGRRPMTDLEDAAETMEVCFAGDISAAEGRPVKLPLG
jgi:UDP-N-acetyl-2-amino-2-deoxyglucuronate dehydrogenase